MSTHDGTDIEQFRLKDIDHTDLFGIFMAVHAVPGAVMLLHTTVGCKFKTQLHLVDHDWFRESHNQRLWTGVDDARLISGSGKRLVEFATTWYERRRPELFVVTTNAAVELSAFDVEAAVDELRMRLPCPVILLKAPGYDGSMWRGYRRLISALEPMLEWDEPVQKDSVGLIGYLFDRFEMDHAANLGEIKRLLGSLGLSMAGTMFGGDSFDQMRATGRASTLAFLPYAEAVAPTFAARGRTMVNLDLPVGLAGTTNFLKTLAGTAGVDGALVDSVVDRELSRIVPRIAHAARRLSGTRVAVFADTPLAAGLVAWLTELGCEVPQVFLIDGPEASEKAFRSAAERMGASFARPVDVFVGPSRDKALAAFAGESDREFIPIVVGTSFQKRAMTGERAVIEIGYPSVDKHWLYPLPWMGYAGALALAQRLVDAVGGAY